MRRAVLLFLYRITVAPLIVLFAFSIGLFIPKIRAGIRLRRRKRPWPHFHHPPIWIHASSGEFEYAKPVIREIKARHPELPIVVSYFSPTFAASIERFPGVDFSLALPLDLPGPTSQFLQRLKPQAGLIARTDLWPELLQQASRLKIPMLLFSATQTKQLNWFIRQYKAWLFGYLRAVLSVTQKDAEYIHQIDPRLLPLPIGDTRFDQVIARLHAQRPVKDQLRTPHERTLVAGSTWSEDESVLLDSVQDLIRTGHLDLILAPHEPTPGHLDAIVADLKKRGLSYQFYSQATTAVPGVLLIDQVGILAELYQWGALAFVGGSFKGSVHSVMEPLAAGALTIVGPYHHNNREALEFQNLRYETTAFVEAADARSLRMIIEKCLSAVAADPEIGKIIQREVHRRSGASERLVDFLELRRLPIEPRAEI